MCVSLLKLFCRTISSNQSQESSDWSSLAAGSVQSASKQECDYEQNSDKKNTLSNLKLYQSFHFDYLITLITWRAMYGLVLQWHVNEFIYLVFIMAICNCIVLSGSFNSASLAESSIQSLYKTIIGTDIKKTKKHVISWRINLCFIPYSGVHPKFYNNILTRLFRLWKLKSFNNYFFIFNTES